MKQGYTIHSEISTPFMTSPIGDLPINSEGMRKAIDYIAQLQCDKNELQKQIDELKIEMHKIESAENETYMIGFEDGEKKAIKDTAKEVLQDIYNKSTCISYYGKQYRAIETVRFDGIVKSNGVEVD